MSGVLETNLTSLPFLHRGKVRDIYAVGDDKLLVVQTDRLSAFDVILDDRGERPGAMFADWELIGVPHRVVLGDKGLKEGLAEYQGRTDAEATKVPVSDVLVHLLARLHTA